jgi:hypothetical protein
LPKPKKPKIRGGEREAVLMVYEPWPRPLKNVQFWSRSRKTKISTAGIYAIFRGLKFVSDTEVGQKGTFFKGLTRLV